MILDKFTIALGFDDKTTQESANKVESIVSNLTSNIKSGLESIGAVNFIAGAIKSFDDLATKLDNLRYRTQVSITNLQAWDNAVERLTGHSDSFNESLLNITNNMANLYNFGGSKFAAGLQRLGISLRDSQGHFKTQLQLMTEIGDKIKQLNAPEYVKQAFAQSLGINPDTLRLLEQGKIKVEDIIKEQQKHNVISEKQEDQFIGLRKSLFDLRLEFEKFTSNVVSKYMPVLQQFLKTLKDIFDNINHNLPALKDFAKDMGNVSTSLRDLMREFKDHKDIITWTSAILGGAAAISILSKPLSLLSGLGKTAGNIATGATSSIAGFGSKLLAGAGLLLSPVSTGDSYEDAFVQKNIRSNTGIPGLISSIARKHGVDPITALAIAKSESNLNPDARQGQALGLYQLGAGARSDFNVTRPFDPADNARGGIENIRRLMNILHTTEGWKLRLGEYLGGEGAKRVLKENTHTLLSSLPYLQASIRANPKSFNGLRTVGDLEEQQRNIYNSAAKSVTMNFGNINVTSNSANPQEVAKQVTHQLSQYAQLINSYDSPYIGK